LQEPQCRPLFERVLERAGVGPATRYLDAGCGAGLAAQIAARRGAQVAGIDAAPNLLAVARERVADDDFREGDIEALPFDDDAFDVVTGFNAFQYAGNPDVALVEARRVARPGGIVVVVTWGKPEGMPAASLVMALRPLLPPPPPGAPGPFALSDEPTLRAFAARAGLGAFEMIDVHSPWHYPDLATALRALGSSGVAARAIEQSGEEALDRAHREALAPFRQPDASYRVEATFRCLFARA
jgi:ubiquinone/menaquinone biosynthesis C-methylase UbiE